MTNLQLVAICNTIPDLLTLLHNAVLQLSKFLLQLGSSVIVLCQFLHLQL